ncbi:hypothetical protein [Streptosporangium sp. NPDC087985]|uniref:hypothetical protein n=1 Tax=Streptosporangium sp. NPDC087985 TaxID=3366196 RepID=UPI003816E3B9
MGKRALGLGVLALLLTACGGTAGSTAGDSAAPPAVPTSTSSADPTPVATPTPSADPTPVATPTPSPTGVNIDGCITKKNGKIFKYTREGMTTQGVIMGKGSVGVVVSYERHGRVCDWLPLADRLVGEGYRVLLFDRNNTATPEKDTVAMADRLREAGVTKMFLVGGSMGGRLSVLAAGMLKFPVAGVISISGGMQPHEAADLTAPFLQVAGDQDGIAPTDLVQAIYNEAVKSADRQLVFLTSRDHASQLFRSDQAERTFTLVTAFIKKHKG